MREDVFYLADELTHFRDVDLTPFLPDLAETKDGHRGGELEGTFTLDRLSPSAWLERFLPPPSLPHIEFPVRRGKIVGKAKLVPTVLRPDGTFSVSVEVLEPRLVTRKGERIRKRRKAQDLLAARRRCKISTKFIPPAVRV